MISAHQARADHALRSTDTMYAGLSARGADDASARYLYAADLFGLKDEPVGFGERDFYVRTISRDVANAVIVTHHYSGRVTWASSLHLGVWIGGEMLGVIQYGPPMQQMSGMQIVPGSVPGEYLELNRMWLHDAAPRNSESRALAQSIRYIRRALPAVKWLQSFADDRCKLCGTVYQAAGFTYHGFHVSRFFELDGEWYHEILFNNTKDTGPRATRIKAEIDRAIPRFVKQYRYMKFLKPRFGKGCRYPAQPFPKPDYATGPEDEPVSSGCEAGVSPAGRSISMTTHHQEQD